MLGTCKRGPEFIKAISEIIAKSSGFERTLEKVKITDGGDGRCTAEFTVAPEHVNRMGSLHGGFTATLVDMITTYALMSKPSHAGVSVDLHVSYIAAAKEGDEIVIDANCVKAGKRLAYIDCELRKKSNGTVIARGAQTKFVDFK